MNKHLPKAWSLVWFKDANGQDVVNTMTTYDTEAQAKKYVAACQRCGPKTDEPRIIPLYGQEVVDENEKLKEENRELKRLLRSIEYIGRSKFRITGGDRLEGIAFPSRSEGPTAPRLGAIDRQYPDYHTD